MALLQVLNPTGDSERVMLQGDRAVLGRHPDCDVVLDAASVSRQHAQIVKDQGQYFVEDLHSRNGTFVNGKRVTGTQLVHGEDLLQFGAAAFRLGCTLLLSLLYFGLGVWIFGLLWQRRAIMQR